jgi:hypothetical protein
MTGPIGESSGVSGSTPVIEVARDGQAGPSAPSQAPDDEPHNSGEPPSIVVTQDMTYHKLTGESRQIGGPPVDMITQPTPPEEPPRMIGDFDDNANALWSLQLKEAENHDEARIQSLKDDMNSFLIFVRVHNSVIILYS